MAVKIHYDDFVMMGVECNNSMIMGFRNNRGVNWTLWPLGLVAYWWQTSTFDPREYHVTY